MSKTSKSILVTGGAGYIGSHIVEQLIKNKEKILRWKPKYNDIKLIIKSAINWEKKLNSI